MKRVVITGMGAVTPLGNTVEEFWDGLKNGKNGIAPITKFDASETGITVAAEVKDFDPTLYMGRKEYRRMDLYSQYAVAAAVQAVADSGLDVEAIDASRFGVIIGSGIGGLIEMESGIIKMHDKGPKRVPPMFVPMTIGNMAAGNTSIKVGAKGISLDIVTACASATNSIGEAFRNIKHGYSDVIIAGGAEGTICEIGIAGFAALTALSESTDPDHASTPFDKNRDGFVMGEGAGVLMLEELEHAKKRGAMILAEVVGYGSNSDAFHMTAPTPDGSGAGEAMKMAMQEAGIGPSDIDYINAHGTSTPANDSAETKAIKYALGEEAAHNVAISSSKSMTGHLLGAAGGIEAIACVKAIENDYLPPTIGLNEPDEACDLDYVANVGREKQVRYTLNNSLGFGGHNAVLCFKKWEEA
ncbi:3-oxoacyl-[acyl-carrier-protein] synthase 2 [Jeotgalibaca dankookensis]|uniref:3-oxoacyl-[acyl-carrier-protein] synthase 2 n=1 Tax=Jeotgalibaca dankookensis TaxID=708126 RepID=A0A1S6IP01_9LACT|nr:beta-ketoacyl-ACP synthase II [Jeotgalibaca dankookensis]AQS53284.1 3-oxoacyl-[acyl-carrier-protein] synthase 2 [Jeotgalibaca dankookensis]